MRIKIVWRKGWAYAHGTAPDGQRVRRSLETQDLRQAEEARAILEAKLWRQGVYGTEAVMTFEAAALAYAEDGGEARFLVPVSEYFKGRVLRTITGKEIRESAVKLYPKAKASTRNRQVIAPASAVINYGHNQGWCPPIRVQRLTEERPARKAVGWDYLEALKPELPERLYALMLFLHTTGRRVGDAVNLIAEDFDGKTALIRDTKNGDPIRVALPKATAEAMTRLPGAHGRVFGYLGTAQLRQTLRRACARAGVEYLGTHQPGRHSFATHLKQAGWDSKAVAEAGGWKTPAMVDDIYTHLSETSARAAKAFDTQSSRAKKKGKKNASLQGS
jgi:integrase